MEAEGGRGRRGGRDEGRRRRGTTKTKGIIKEEDEGDEAEAESETDEGDGKAEGEDEGAS